MTLWPRNWIELFITTFAITNAANLVLQVAVRHMRLWPLAGVACGIGAILFCIGFLMGVLSRRLRDDPRYQVIMVASLTITFLSFLTTTVIR